MARAKVTAPVDSVVVVGADGSCDVLPVLSEDAASVRVEGLVLERAGLRRLARRGGGALYLTQVDGAAAQVAERLAQLQDSIVLRSVFNFGTGRPASSGFAGGSWWVWLGVFLLFVLMLALHA